MILFFTAFGISLLVTIAAYFVSKQICWREAGIMVAGQLVVAGTSALICYHQTLSDTEVRNSFVVSKKREWVSCSHSYSCNCRTVTSGSGKDKTTTTKCTSDSGKDKTTTTKCTSDSGKDKTTTTKCDTCYEHTNDWDWAVYSAAQQRFEIDRIDRRGSNEPPRFTQVQMGEPTVSTYDYDNYIKAAPDTLFRKQGQVEKFQRFIPQYPLNIYDYYRLNRLILVNGATVEDPQYWEADISRLNADIGASKQTNVVIVLTKNLPPDYFYALEQAWFGGKKNDVIVVANLEGKRPTWVNVMAWDNNELLKIKIRDELMDKPTLDRWDCIDVLKRNIQQYRKRKSMKDFEYLTASIVPSTTQWIVTLIIGVLISIALSVVMYKNEFFPDY